MANEINIGSFIRIFFGTTGKPMMMAQSDEISNKSTEEETSSKDSGLDYESIIVKRMTDLKGSADLVLLTSGTTKTTYDQVDDWQRSGELVPFFYGLIADKDATTLITGSKKFAGNVRFTDVSIKADDKKKATFSWSAKTQGAVVKTTVV
jgi:hypothetical protein